MSSKTVSLFAYPNTHSFVKGMQKQSLGDYRIIKSYFRSGFPELANLERRVARLLQIDERRGESLLLTTSGMSAVVTALEIASPTAGDIVIHGLVEYGKIQDYINDDLVKRGVITIEINPDSVEAIEKLLLKFLKEKPKVKIKAIFLETVGNGPPMPTLRLEKFLGLKVLRQINPLIIIDNTLPTEVAFPLLTQMRKNKDLNIVGVQSATKFYLRNEDLGGILYVVSDKLRNELFIKRTRNGSTPGLALVRLFDRVLANEKQFNQEIKTFMYNTNFLAKCCEKVAGNGKKFTVDYPNLSDGISPVFFLTTAPTSGLTTEELFYKLEETGAFVDMVITESFGFKKTGVSHGTRYGGYIRVAGGLEDKNEITKLGKRLQRALANL